MRKLVIERAAVKNNLSVIQKRTGGAAICAVLSGSGAGEGVVPMARLLRDMGIGHFAVSEIQDLEQLRMAGFVDEEILMLRSTTDAEELEQLLDLNAVCTISSVDSGMALNAQAARRSTVAAARIQIDTGLGFGGFLAGEPEKILLAYRSLPNVALEGVCTQIHFGKHGDSASRAQLEQFRGVLDTIQKAGYETGTVHAAGCLTLPRSEEFHFDGVVAATDIMGRCPRTRGDGLVTVGYGETPVTEVRWLPKGHTVGGDRPVRLRRSTRIAVIQVGFMNGFGMQQPENSSLAGCIRSWQERRHVFVHIRGQAVPVLGSIGANETVLNVTGLKCSAGDLATFDIDPMFASGFVPEYR